MSAATTPRNSSRDSDPSTITDDREAITYFNPMENREADQVPLQWSLVRRVYAYTAPYAWKRNWLFVLTILRGLQLPAMAWMIGRIIDGPIAARDWPAIEHYAAAYLALTVFMIVTLHYRQRYALEMGESVVHDMRRDLFEKLTTLPMSFFNKTKFGRIISRMTSDIDNVRVGVQDVGFVLTGAGDANGRRRVGCARWRGYD